MDDHAKEAHYMDGLLGWGFSKMRPVCYARLVALKLVTTYSLIAHTLVLFG